MLNEVFRCVGVLARDKYFELSKEVHYDKDRIEALGFWQWGYVVHWYLFERESCRRKGMENTSWAISSDLEPLALQAAIDIFFNVTIAALPGVIS